MIRSLKAAAVFSGALVVGICLSATAKVPRAYADAAPGAATPGAHRQTQTQAQALPPDPKKKMPGADCKSSDECQNHHTCAKVGDKNVCQAPQRSRLPPGAVT